MFDILYRYLIRNRQISLSGIGTLSVQVRPSISEFVDRTFLPPVYSFVFEPGKETSSRKLFSWLAAAFNITERQAVIRFNDFLFDLKRELEAGNEITWQGVGSLRKGLTGEISLDAVKKDLIFQQPVIAAKVMRENAEHIVLVGEREKTSTEMTEILLAPSPIEEKRSYWWVWPLAIIIISFIFLGWYFSEHGMSSTGNNQKFSPAKAPSGYHLTP